MSQVFTQIKRVKGELNLPGDKSISHRAVIFSAMAEGRSLIKNLSPGQDVNSTISCFRQMGVNISKNNDLSLIDGRGFKGLSQPSASLFAGNSGTTARLLSGLMTAQEFHSKLTGDLSLSRRPMARIMEPLKLMGADIKSVTSTLPLEIFPVLRLHSIDYRLLIPSAQVKSAVILAGLHLDEESRITEYLSSRDHTERMLNLSNAEEDGKNVIYFSRKNYPVPQDYFIPSDISSSIFFIVLTLLTKDSELLIKNVSLNPGRMTILGILKEMGGDIEMENVKVSGNEPYGDVIVRSSELHNVEIPAEKIPGIIDEIPALSIAGIFASGDFTITGAQELRQKESDRIDALCRNLRRLGLKVEEYIDGFTVSGEILDHYTTYSSYGDHRIAMAFAVLSMLLKSGGEIDDFECAAISNPDFLNQAASVTS